MIVHKALEGVKVLDFTWSEVGPLTTMTLGQHGATVIRVETHHRLDFVRVSGPFKDGVAGIDRSGFYGSLNANKFSISIDLNNPGSTDVTRRLVEWADVVIEGLTPGKMAKWNLDYESVRAARPDIVYVSTSIQGQTGPYSRQGGYGPQATACAGLYELTGASDGPPNFIYAAYTDSISPYYLVTVILASLVRRRRTGKGLRIDQSQIEAGIFHLGSAILEYTANNRLRPRIGNRDPYMAPHGCYRCLGESRFCVIAVRTDDEWKEMCAVLGGEEWLTDSRFASSLDRKSHEDELDRLIEERTSKWVAHSLMWALQKRGVPVGVVQNAEDLFEDPQLLHRGHFQWLDHPILGEMPYHSPSFRLSEAPGRTTRSAPCLGQDNEYVFGQILGYTDEELSDFMAEGVITFDSGDSLAGTL